MVISQKIREIMIPLSSAATATADMPLKEAIRALRKLYCEVEEGKCTEAGFRTIVILDRNRTNRRHFGFSIHHKNIDSRDSRQFSGQGAGSVGFTRRC